MATTPVLITLIAACFALVTGAFYALISQVNARMDDMSSGLSRFESTMETRFDRFESKVDAKIDRLESKVDARFARSEAQANARFDRLDESVTGLRASIAGIDSRLSTLEQRG